MLARIPNDRLRWRRGELSDAAMAALYFLRWQLHLHGGQAAARRSKSDPRPDLERWMIQLENLPDHAVDETLIGWFGRYQFKGIIGAVPMALKRWLEGAWALALLESIPKPLEVLAMQIAGQRPVTVMADPSRMLAPVLGKANGFVFLVHDLEHAHKFFADPELHEAQRQFFRTLGQQIEAGSFRLPLRDAEFAAKFDYLISDMNTHPAHSLQYLRAVLIEASLRLEGRLPEDSLSDAAEVGIDRLIARIENSVGILVAAAFE